MIGIDAHQHFWRIDRGDYGWLTATDHPVIHRDFGPDDIAPHLTAAGISRTILVQAAPTVAETRWLLDLARQTPIVAGVVGWVDFDASDAIAMLEELAADPMLLGVRPMVQNIADPDWLARSDLAPVFDALVRLGLRFDALVKPAHLAALRTMVSRHPDLTVIVDHGAKPDIAGGIWGPWANEMSVLASMPSVCCKLSGLPSEAGRDWHDDRLRRYVDYLAHYFGSERLMWGSDWPVVEEAGGYGRWHDTARALIDPAWHEALFGTNAARVYGVAS